MEEPHSKHELGRQKVKNWKRKLRKVRKAQRRARKVQRGKR